MTTERELLELAAKAARVDGYTEAWVSGWYFVAPANPEIMYSTPTFYHWLTDDGDALRLAVKIGVVIGTYANYSTVDLLSPNDRIETVTVWHSETNNDPYAATRLAIVRSAAEIGRGIA